jgi:hypothetical protein
MLEVVKRLGYAEAIQSCVTSQGFLVDLFIKDNLLLEIVPQFGLLSDDVTLTGRWAFKHRLIEREGFIVVSVRVAEWKALQGNKSAQLEFMEKRLKREDPTPSPRE